MTDSPAGPSNFNAIPLPDTVKPDNLFQSDEARAHLSSKRSIFKFSPRRKRKLPVIDQPSSEVEHHDAHPDQQVSARGEAWADQDDPQSLEMPFVQLGDAVVYSSSLEEDYSKDVYRWAVLYENQRGITIFSTRYYSPLSLLPIDPPPFTVPSASTFMRNSQPTVSLDAYPLPDGSWRWVSRAWMVDMRGEGQTQYDGFQYNWFFRSKHWRYEIGSLSAGGWVRRRRWVRLMMRPALSGKMLEGSSLTPTPHMLFQNIIHLEHHEVGMTRPPSVVSSHYAGEDDGDSEIWRGNVREDWERCHSVLRGLGTDGRQLEQWRDWLGSSLPQDRGKHLQWTGDEGPFVPRPLDEVESGHSRGQSREITGNTEQLPEKQHVASVLRSHAADILQLLVYPDSRTRFFEMVALEGLAADLNAGLGPSRSMQVFDFYSSSQSLQNLPDVGSGSS